MSFVVFVLASLLVSVDALKFAKSTKSTNETRARLEPPVVNGLNKTEVRFAIMTLSDGEWIQPGVEVLGCSLSNFAEKNNIDLLALCYNMNKTQEQRLQQRGWSCVELEEIRNPTHRGRKDWPFDYTMKIAPFSMTQYDRILLLDSDTVAINADGFMDLLTMPLEQGHILAVPDCFSRFINYWDRDEYGKPLMPFGSAANYALQAGMLGIQPSLEMYEKLKASVNTTVSVDAGGQGFMSEFFRGKVQWLPAKYNYIKATNCIGLVNTSGYYDLNGRWDDHDWKMCDDADKFTVREAEKKTVEAIDTGDVVLTHFQWGPKPWDCNRSLPKEECAKDAWGGTTRVDALFDAWLAVYDTCQ